MKYEDLLISGNFRIIIGSGSHTLLEPNDDSIAQLFEQMIRHYFQDNDFVQNNLYGEDYIEYRRLFNENVLVPLMSDLNAFKEQYLTLGYPYPESNTKHWTIKEDFDPDAFFKEFIMSTKFMSLFETFCSE